MVFDSFVAGRISLAVFVLIEPVLVINPKSLSNRLSSVNSLFYSNSAGMGITHSSICAVIIVNEGFACSNFLSTPTYPLHSFAPAQPKSGASLSKMSPISPTFMAIASISFLTDGELSSFGSQVNISL